ncbi:hypothetical protein LSH36_555g04015 [Paralvinella palmiformis]|uniref:Uncharacterized protein n=1 Tax=Paralvinella palmiformis TaxID=53620 RepID=A0AAD9J6J4_9ANNE|nr:hypothetical protein LSH36_555g04015 [Paralvinella palmiformis]
MEPEQGSHVSSCERIIWSADLLYQFSACSELMTRKMLGLKLVPEFKHPRKYIGELTGIEYLLKQTGQPLQDMTTDIEGPDIDDVESTDDLRTHTRKTYTTLNMVAS